MLACHVRSGRKMGIERTDNDIELLGLVEPSDFMSSEFAAVNVGISKMRSVRRKLR